MPETEIQMLLGIATLITTGLLFPFVLHNFKRNEKLHDETRNKLEQQNVTIAGHEIRIVSLEEFRRYQTQGTAPTTNVIHN